MKTVTIHNPDLYWDIAADIHFPPNFDQAKKYPAIISAHPIGSCKEQTSGNVYGQALAEAGFVSSPLTAVSRAQLAASLDRSKIQLKASRISGASPII